MKTFFLFGLMVSLQAVSVRAITVPQPTVTPTIYTPELLPWDLDRPSLNPDLSEPTSNRIYDLHLNIADCTQIDSILSTSGNYHMALREYWFERFLTAHPEIKNWYFSTSPPISPEQAQNSALSFGNVHLRCQPHLAVGPQSIMDKLRADGLSEGDPIPLLRNQGNVLLVKKGNPKNIRTIWDLARKDVKIATSNPFTEPGSFGNYHASLYRMAFLERGKIAADRFHRAIFGTQDKWITGARIHHREVPHLIAFERADAAPLFYHLAIYFQRTFPDRFEIVPLGGTANNPNPKPGNRVAQLYMIRINTNLTPKQRAARENLIKGLRSSSFHEILIKHRLEPPQ